MADQKTRTATTEDRMKGQAITFHDLAVSLYRSRAGCVSRAQTATGAGDFRAASLHIASAENLTQWADTLMGPGWKEYAKPYAYQTPPPPQAPAGE